MNQFSLNTLRKCASCSKEFTKFQNISTRVIIEQLTIMKVEKEKVTIHIRMMTFGMYILKTNVSSSAEHINKSNVVQITTDAVCPSIVFNVQSSLLLINNF